MILLTCAGALVAALVGPWLLPILFGSAFQAAVVPFLLLLPGALGFVFMSIFSSGLIGSAAPGRSSLGAIVALPVGVALDFLLIPRYGASGAAAAASAALIAGGATALIAYRSRHAFALRAVIPGRADALAIFTSIRRVLTKRSHA